MIEGWPVWDAFYMTVTTVTTVGYREIHELSLAGQRFTVLLIMGGVGTALYAATLLAAAVVEGGLHRHFSRRRFVRMLDQLRDHFIICGYGRIGSLIAAELHQQGVPFVIIDRDPARVQEVRDRGWLALAADASREEALTQVGIARARGFITAVNTDAENVFAVLTARVMNPALFIIARVEADDAEGKLRRAGADRVISPYHIGATHMAQSALRPAVVDFMELATSSAHLDLSMEQVMIREQSPLAGRTIGESGIRQKFGVIIVAIKRAAAAMEFNPPPEAVLRTGDELVVLGPPRSVKELEEMVV
jgi:voltage-gated potassium channel